MSSKLRNRIFLFCFVILALPSGAQKPDPRILPLVKKQVESMLELASWCQANGLARERNRIFEALLALDQDHAFARKESGWKRLGKTKWDRVKGFRRSIRTNPSMAREWKIRAAGIVDSYATKVAPRLASLAPKMAPIELRRLTLAMQILSPRNDQLRILLGEKKVGRRWLLRESVATKRRRKTLAQRARLLLAGAGEPAEVGLTLPERRVEMAWKKPRYLQGVRVVGTVPDREIVSACQLARAAIMYVRTSMRADVQPFQDFTIYLLASRDDAQRFFHFYPGVSESNRRFADGLSSCWLQGSSKVVIWPEDKNRRTEWVARQTIAMLLQNGWNITTKNAVLFEGLGIYLSHKLCGFRTTWYVRPSRYARAGQDRDEAGTLKKTKDWLRLARRRLSSTPPKYRRLFAHDVNQMVTDDLLDSYVFAAYLLETAATERESYLKKIGAGTNFETAVVDVWGMDVPALQNRVLRWLKETKAL